MLSKTKCYSLDSLSRARDMGAPDLLTRSFAPRITFVDMAEKWRDNQPAVSVAFAGVNRARRARAAAADASADAAEASLGRADLMPRDDTVDATRIASGASSSRGDDGDKGSEGRAAWSVALGTGLERWIADRGIVVSEPKHFVDVEALYDLYVRDVHPEGKAPDLVTFSSMAGKTLRRVLAPATLARRVGKLSVTCKALPATRENWPPRMANKKAEKIKKHGPKDPGRSRPHDLVKRDKDSTGATCARYVSEMLKLACGPELVRLRVFPDAKELTEAFAASNAIRTHLWSRYKPNDERVCLIAVGDGNTPRSAALCAFLTRWQCVAVDPEMVPWRDWRRRHKIQDATWSSCEVKEGDEIDEEGDTHGWGGIRRLQVHRRKMQEMVVECELALIVMIHAHISLKDVLAAVKTKSGECAAVILPCCNWYSRLAHPDGATAPCHEYEDDAVVSPQRTVRVFSSLPCGVSGAGDGVPCPEVVA